MLTYIVIGVLNREKSSLKVHLTLKYARLIWCIYHKFQGE